jgi:hypothetical protein
VSPAPRLAVPDVAALGPVPQTADELDVYLARLATVSRALNFAQAAYARALDERSELLGQLEAYAIKAARLSQSGKLAGPAGRAGNTSISGNAVDDESITATAVGDDDLAELLRRAREVLTARPADMARARALAAAHQAYLAARSSNGLTRGTV